MKKQMFLVGMLLLAAVGSAYAWKAGLRQDAVRREINLEDAEIQDKTGISESDDSTVRDATINDAPVKKDVPPSPNTGNEAILGVRALLLSKESYAGKTVSVKGTVRYSVYQSLRPCSSDEPDCNTIMGGDMFLIDITEPSGEESALFVYKSGKKILCEEPFQNPDEFACLRLAEGQPTVLQGTFVKTQVPASSVGYSDGRPPQTTSWKDFYYLDVR